MPPNRNRARAPARDRKKSPFRRLKIRGQNWKVTIARPPENNCLALCDYSVRTIWIRPTGPNKFESLVHELLHACFPDTTEEAVTESAIAITCALHILPKMPRFTGRCNYRKSSIPA